MFNSHVRFYSGFVLSMLLVAVMTLSCNQTSNEPTETTVVNDTITDEITRLNEAVKASPLTTTPYLNRAKYLSYNNQYNEALADINTALDINDQDPQIYIALSDVYFYSGKTQRALDALKKAKEFDPNNAIIDVNTARIFLTMSNYQSTFASLREALKKDPENAEAFFVSGLANEEMGDTLLAIDNYQNAVARNNKHYEALKQLGILFSIKKNPLAIDYLRNAAGVNPKAPEPLYILGMYYQENDDADKALSVYQEILQIDSTFKLAHYNTGYVYMVYKLEFNEAVDAFSRALQLDPEYTDALYNRGYANELAGNLAEARKDYEGVLRMQVNDDKAVQGLNRLDAAVK